MKQKYLQEVRKKMFWKFSAVEIEDVLEDVDTYFAEASKEGISDEQFVKCYGTPQQLVAELMELQSVSSQQKNRQVFSKVTYVVLSILCMILFALFLKQEVAVLFNMILGAALMWFLSGCRYNVKRNVDKSKKNTGVCLQAIFWTICIAMQLCAMFLVPFWVESVPNAKEIGPVLNSVIQASILIMSIAFIVCMKGMLNGNVHMFFTSIGYASLGYSLYLYTEHLKRLVDLENLSFVFYPCFFSAIIQLVFWKFGNYSGQA